MFKIVIDERVPKNEIWVVNYDAWDVKKLINLAMPENDQPVNPTGPDEGDED